MDRITRIFIENVRTIRSAELTFAPGMTVLTGDPGTGKSTIVECLELLRKAGRPGFGWAFVNVHGGLASLLRKGESTMSIGVCVSSTDGVAPDLMYRLQFTPSTTLPYVVVEELWVHTTTDATPINMLHRHASGMAVWDEFTGKTVNLPLSVIGDDSMAIVRFGRVPPNHCIDRLIRVLDRIEVHVPFDTMAHWASRSQRREQWSRSSGPTVGPRQPLGLTGADLVNAWARVTSSSYEVSEESLALLRLGLGNGLETLVFTRSREDDTTTLYVQFRDFADPIPSSDLSEGQLAWVAFVALLQLNPHRCLLVLDNPDAALHPKLIHAIITALRQLPAPVVITTHSDHLLSQLHPPTDHRYTCNLGHSFCSTIERVR